MTMFHNLRPSCKESIETKVTMRGPLVVIGMKLEDQSGKMHAFSTYTFRIPPDFPRLPAKMLVETGQLIRAFETVLHENIRSKGGKVLGSS